MYSIILHIISITTFKAGKKFEIQKNESNPKNSYESEPKLVKYLNHFN